MRQGRPLRGAGGSAQSIWMVNSSRFCSSFAFAQHRFDGLYDAVWISLSAAIVSLACLRCMYIHKFHLGSSNNQGCPPNSMVHHSFPGRRCNQLGSFPPFLRIMRPCSTTAPGQQVCSAARPALGQAKGSHQEGNFRNHLLIQWRV